MFSEGIDFWLGENENMEGVKWSNEGDFSRWGELANFWLVGILLPSPIYIWEMVKSSMYMKKLRVHHIHQVAILLLQDFSTLCATDIYGIYFCLSVQCF